MIYNRSGCGEVWYHATFGKWRPRVQVPTFRIESFRYIVITVGIGVMQMDDERYKAIVAVHKDKNGQTRCNPVSDEYDTLYV